MNGICFCRMSARLSVLGIVGLMVLFAGCGQREGAPEEPKNAGGRQTDLAQATGVHQQVNANGLGVGEEITNSIGMKLKLIPAGEFRMGSGKSPEEIVRLFDLDADAAMALKSEHPQHRVRITRPYYLGATEVTQGQWGKVMGTYPWPGGVKENTDYPATNVNWEDALEFCRKLSTKELRTYRLPTEAEWEYACRAGTTTRYHFGDDATRLGEYAWNFDNAWNVDEKYAHRVGQKRPNGFGLYDMHGNVYEWCSDWYGEEYYGASPSSDPTGPPSGLGRVFRGGGWTSVPGLCRSALRGGTAPGNRSSGLGFRVALDLPDASGK